MTDQMSHAVSISMRHAPLARAWTIAAAAVAVLAGLFTLVIALVLIAQHLSHVADDPMDNPQLVEMKAELRNAPQDEALLARYRTLDLQLRQSYFQHRQRLHIGAYLMIGGAIVAIAAGRFAASQQRHDPRPAENAPDVTSDRRERKAGMRAVSGLAGLIVIVSLGLTLHPPLSIGTTAPRLVDVDDAEDSEQRLGPAPVADWPSEAELAANWPRFRGWRGDGVAPSMDIPLKWDAESGRNIRWRTPIDLPGANSAIVWEDAVFCTGADAQTRRVYCFDALTGGLRWSRDVDPPRASPAQLEAYQDTGYAASTPATDGRRVYAIFANGDLAAFDFAGNLVWQKALGVPDNIYTYATSLLTWRNLLLVLFDQGELDGGQSKLFAFDSATGEVVWQVDRPVGASWATPIIAPTEIDGRIVEQLITCATPWAIAYDVADGRQRWQADLLGSDVAPSPIFADGLVIITAPWMHVAAVRPDGEGDVTDTHVAWTITGDIPDITSPVSDGEHLLLLSTMGWLVNYAMEDGQMIWEQEVAQLLDDYQFLASPSLVGERVVLFSAAGKSLMAELGAQGLVELGRGHLHQHIQASPAFHKGRIYMRGAEEMFCIDSIDVSGEEDE